ncbi:MAG: Crp/Fnr family transcriptional regulator [Bryobacterales bacterium]|nr:Crp/Fnr family transcriptional regulator [Bryobacterales bacterium]
MKAAGRTTALRVRSSTLLSLAWQNEDLTRWLWQQQQHRQAELLSRISLLTKEGVHRRVILTLAGLAERSGGSPMPLAQKEVADLAGATRETTSTLLNRMRRRGLVQLGRRMIHVPSAAALREIQSLEESDVEEAAAVMAMA